jgi:hypothetical protein
MKALYRSALRCKRQSFAVHHLLQGGIYSLPVFFFLLISIGLLFMACQKESARTAGEDVQTKNSAAANAENDVVTSYTGLSSQTTWELQQARAATAKYRNINNAIRDGYADIEVDVEHMGHHFMKTAIVDGTFDIREPEILVYNKNDDGTQELVAVEYAIPLSNPRPEGFTGSSDVWNGDSGFPLWLVHAWVWAYNPDGVFNWTNPTVHLH